MGATIAQMTQIANALEACILQVVDENKNDGYSQTGITTGGAVDGAGNTINYVDQNGNPIPNGVAAQNNFGPNGEYLGSFVDYVNKTKFAASTGNFNFNQLGQGQFISDPDLLSAGTILDWSGPNITFTLDSTQCVLVSGFWSFFASNARLDIVVEFQITQNGSVLVPWSTMSSGGNSDVTAIPPNDQRSIIRVPECFTLNDMPAGDYEIDIRLLFSADSAMAVNSDPRVFSVGSATGAFHAQYESCTIKI